MRSAIQWSSLCILSVALIGLFGYRVSKDSKAGDFSGISSQETELLKNEFQASHPAEFELNLESWIPSNRWQDLASPATHLPGHLDGDYASLSALYRYAESCNPKDLRKTKPSKAQTWHRFRCGQLKSLPKDFFVKSPWIHPNGTSYALIALQTAPELFDTREGKLALVSYLHALDFAKVDSDLLNPSQKRMSQLDRETLASFFKLDPIVFQKTQGLKGTLWLNSSDNRYLAYSFDDWTRFIDKRHLIVSRFTPQGPCVLKQGNLCFNPDYQSRFARMGRSNLALLTLSILLALGLFGALFRGLQRQGQESEKRRFAFRMLVHELRTPITNLVLINEQLRTQFDSLPPPAQDLALDLFSQTDRLKNISEASGNYLRSESPKLIQLKIQTLQSLKEYLYSFLENTFPDTAFTLLGSDFQIQTDPYWFSLVLRNILSNAYEHGIKPVTLTATDLGNRFEIKIQDQGIWDGIPQLNAQAKGMGIGLQITRQTILAMGGEISFTAKPSTTTLVFDKVLKT